jgi:hypothetical protein
MDAGKELVDIVKGAADRLGKGLSGNLDDVRAYAAARMLHLSGLVGKPGYAEALLDERDNVALKLGLAAVSGADAADRELIGTVGGVLAMGARALAGGA